MAITFSNTGFFSGDCVHNFVVVKFTPVMFNCDQISRSQQHLKDKTENCVSEKFKSNQVKTLYAGSHTKCVK